ncbi:hypothetical protein [Nocardia stercoris]|uniref:hypothetical protein n=1 Tax=Nocardia stercoris TaxID=2483361 RepID=UPI00131A289F|nr:hypothetical protein [Nocardia stercoris]
MRSVEPAALENREHAARSRIESNRSTALHLGFIAIGNPAREPTGKLISRREGRLSR